jgi:transposase-like protein
VPRKTRRHFTTNQKVAILRRHLVDKVPVSEVCAENDLQPSVFYDWQRVMLENLGSALQPATATTTSREKELERENEALRAKLAKKDSVIAEISEEYVTLKKELGEP